MTKSFDSDLEILESKSSDSIILKSHDKIILFYIENRKKIMKIRK